MLIVGVDVGGTFTDAIVFDVETGRVVAIGGVDKPPVFKIDEMTEKLTEAIKERRKVCFEGSFIECPIYQRELLPAGASVDGPAIIEEYGSTTVLFPLWKASVDSFGNLILERKGG